MDSTTLDDHRWQRMRQLFLEISPLGNAAREACLTGEDESVAAAVRRLLALHDEMTGSGTGDSERPPIAAALSAAYDKALHRDGTTIAQFRLERLLGEGGMGRVYLAQREIGGNVQRVALKIVPLAIRTPRLIGQLRRERAILAGLDHPHIARLIDAGELPDGHPYFAMEYVDGIPLLRYCDEAGLDLRARLKLFLDVCDAVAYAHRQLVLHRDLKSSNILVDADGRLRLLDFGIAKSLEDVQTRDVTSDNFFSLRAASPEQVLGKPSTISTDVYGLGCLLYELLAGRPPFRLDESSRENMIRRIAHEPPPLASAAVVEDADSTVSSRRQLASVPALATALRGDLDTVLARALRKDPAERYRSADELAGELRNVLELRPIAARASERWYRLRMLLRRHRATAAVAAVLSLAVLITTAVSVVQYFRAEAERDRAVEALVAAQVQRDHAQHVADFLINAFTAADPGRGRATEMRAGELIEKAAAALENKSATLEPGVHARLAQTLSRLYFRLDRRDEAARQTGIARDTIATISDPPLELLVRQDVAESGTAVLHDKFAEAAEFARRGVERIGDPAQFSDTELLLQLWELRVRSSTLLGQNREAIEYADTALALLRARPDLRPEQIEWLRQRRATIVSDSGNSHEALVEVKSLVAERRATNRVNDLEYVDMLNLLGTSNLRAGDYPAALAAYEEGLAKHRELYGSRNTNDRMLMNLFMGLAVVYSYMERAPEAAQLLHRAIELAHAKYGETNTFLEVAYLHLASCYVQLGNPSASEFFFRRALRASPEQSRGNRALTRRYLGANLQHRGKLFEAACELEQSLREMQEIYGHGFQIDAATVNLAEIDLLRFDLAGAAARINGSLLSAVRAAPADNKIGEQAERLGAYFGWNRADGTTIVPPLNR